jgi:hypothetical protein
MNWDSLGAIAEMVGAIGVIVSLLYVAAQIKQSNRLIQSDAGYAAVAESNRFLELTITEAAVADLLVKLGSDTAITPKEEIRADAMAERLINNWWLAENSFRKGVIDEEGYQAVVEDAARCVKSNPQLLRHFRHVLSFYSLAAEMNVMAPIFDED